MVACSCAMTTSSLPLAFVALATQSLCAATSHAISNGDCTLTPGSAVPWASRNLTVHDIDDSCCATMKKALEEQPFKLPKCVIDKNFTEYEWAGGHACSGDVCDLTEAVPIPNLTITSFDGYGMSAKCCHFYHTKQPPVPMNCPPLLNFCLKLEGSCTKHSASAVWFQSLVRLAGDQKQTGEDVVVV